MSQDRTQEDSSPELPASARVIESFERFFGESRQGKLSAFYHHAGRHRMGQSFLRLLSRRVGDPIFTLLRVVSHDETPPSLDRRGLDDRFLFYGRLGDKKRDSRRRAGYDQTGHSSDSGRHGRDSRSRRHLYDFQLRNPCGQGMGGYPWPRTLLFLWPSWPF